LLAVVGNLARDLFPGRPPRIGGCAFYGARALRLLGRPARIVTKCAEEHRTQLMPQLVGLGVPVVWRAAASTTTFTFEYHGEERHMEVEAVGDPWTPDELREAVADARWIHVGPLLRSDFPVETIAFLARGRRLSLDAQGLVRVPERGPLRLDASFDRELLRHVAVLKVSEEEAVAIGSVEELGVPEVLLTRGSRGSTIIVDGKAEDVPAFPILGVDPTGAGDVFAVVYLASRGAGFAPGAAARRATAAVAEMLAGRRQ
jgi:sugar/nucleoside kinase (ribokinase family)